MKPVTELEKTLFPVALNLFFLVIKTFTVVLFLFVAVLVISQSSVSAVSTRLLGLYAMEYAEHKIKPYRIYFPKPYMVNLAEEKR